MEKQDKKLEQEEEEATLQVRKSRNVHESQKSIGIYAVDDEVSDGHVIQSNGANSEVSNDQKIAGLEGLLVNESQAINGQRIISDCLPFYDKDGDSGGDAHPGDDSSSSSNTQPSQISFQEHGSSYKSSKEMEKATDVDLINGDELEGGDLHVERVLEKQTTHDLYCPNCNSCITKRVILRKRKCRIRISDEEAKLNKIESKTVEASSDEVHHIDDVVVDDSSVPTAADGDERDIGADIFRCLSCFSFFTPTGNGFKLFRIFGEKSRTVNVEDEQVSSVKRNWFASIFASNKQESAVGLGSSSQTNVQTSDVGVLPSLSSIGDQSGHTQSIQKAHTSAHAFEGLIGITGTDDTLQAGDNILPFLSQQPTLNGNAVIGEGYKLDETTTEKIDAEMEALQAYAGSELKEPKSGKEDRVDHESDLLTPPPNGTQVTTGEAIQLLPSSVSALKASDLDAKLNVSVAAPHEEPQLGATVPTETLVHNKNAKFASSISGQVYPTELSRHINIESKFEVPARESLNVDSIPSVTGASITQGEDTVISIDAKHARLAQTAEDAMTTVDRWRTEMSRELEVEVIKSIVYGGLLASITSLGVVSSAAGGNATTLHILALGMANLIGGLIIICHNLWELRCDRIDHFSSQISNQATEQIDRYKELLGRRENFILHAVVSILSYLIFGLVPPLAYGLSFHKIDDRDLKLVVVAAISLLCIISLAIGRAHVQRTPKPYLKSVVTFFTLGFMVSGVSYGAGILVERILQKLALFQPSPVANLLLPEMRRTGSTRASY